MADEQWIKLIEKYLAGSCSEPEKLQVEQWFENLSDEDKAFYQGDPGQIRQAAERSMLAIRKRIAAEDARVVKLMPKRRFAYIAAAASILLCCSIGLYVYLNKPTHSPLTAHNSQQDIAPGGNKAILTLSNGQKIVLNGKQGKIASQAGKQILVSANGEISYKGSANTAEPIYNTLTVPTGNRRDLTLPDGTEVSLDAGSSITYPVVFDKERRISMTGQAYIKVRHDAAHPFYTSVKGVTIKDIGTEFNINAYDDEPGVKTTLVEGSLQVNDHIIQPGQQAQSTAGSTSIKAADLDAVTAWKDNNFYFDNQSLKSSMRQIARWYNISIVYNQVDEKLKIFADVSRSTNLSVVLKALENTGKVKCSLDGHTLTISQPN